MQTTDYPRCGRCKTGVLLPFYTPDGYNVYYCTACRSRFSGLAHEPERDGEPIFAPVAEYSDALPPRTEAPHDTGREAVPEPTHATEAEAMEQLPGPVQSHQQLDSMAHAGAPKASAPTATVASPQPAKKTPKGAVMLEEEAAEEEEKAPVSVPVLEHAPATEAPAVEPEPEPSPAPAPAAAPTVTTEAVPEPPEEREELEGTAPPEMVENEPVEEEPSGAEPEVPAPAPAPAAEGEEGTAAAATGTAAGSAAPAKEEENEEATADVEEEEGLDAYQKLIAKYKIDLERQITPPEDEPPEPQPELDEYEKLAAKYRQQMEEIDIAAKRSYDWEKGEGAKNASAADEDEDEDENENAANEPEDDIASYQRLLAKYNAENADER